MPEKLKEILDKILAWWKKFTSRQRTIIIAAAAITILTFAFVIYAFSRPQYVRLGTYNDSVEASEVIKILEDAGITHREPKADLSVIEVLAGDEAKATYALASGGYRAGSLKYEDIVNTSMTTTSADRENMVTLLISERIRRALEIVDQIKSADVQISRPKNFGTLAAQQEESSASITLVLKEPLSSTQASSMARIVAVMLGNKTTANIAIWDSEANMLFAGGDDYSEAGIAHSSQELMEQMQNRAAYQAKSVLLGTRQYDIISVAPHLDVDYSAYERTTKKYFAPDGREEGLPIHQQLFDSNSSGGVGGVPGTDSNGNDLTGYQYPDYSNSEANQTESYTDYVVDETAEYLKRAAGTSVNYGSSSLAISMIKVRVYNEDTVRSQGLLDGITWEQFKEEHREDVKLTVDEEYYQLAATSTGIPRNNIHIMAYETAEFHDREGVSISATDVLSIIMIVLILALLAVVVLRSMAGRKAAEEEEELSVENMLQSNPEDQLEDIEVDVKSETRKLIEKFVDDNPDFAANLLRNWLNEDWG